MTINRLRPQSQRLIDVLYRHVSTAPRAYLFSNRPATRLGDHCTLSSPISRPLVPRSHFSAFHTAVSRRNASNPVASFDTSQERKTLPYRPAPRRNPDEPVYELAFTCKPCGCRSAHTISKQGYHKGTVLVTCPRCKNRHLIADHLHIFSDHAVTLQDLMSQKGEEIQKGTVGPQGEIEFWQESRQKDTVNAEDQSQSSPAAQITNS